MTNDEIFDNLDLLDALAVDVDDPDPADEYEARWADAEPEMIDMSDLDPALLDNEHNDAGHEPGTVKGCPQCDGTPIDAPRPAPSEAKASKPTGRANFDHSGCSHTRDKAGRAACRKARAKVS